VKALFVSGYSADILSKEGVLDAGVDMIAKPLSPMELVRKVREVLDR
jgi:DNA-binding response OmpR family regulator